MQIINLASGSKANSTFVSFGETKILIDAGLTEKQLRQELLNIGENLDDINAILITHEHIDHIRAIKSIAKHTNILIYIQKNLANLDTFKELGENVRTFDNTKFNLGDFEIEPIEISHDALNPVAFVVNVFKSKAKVAFLTDLGVVSEQIKRAIKGVKIIFIESNYDENMIDGGPYPYIVKQRIKGDQGHLSNSQSLELAKFLFENGTRHFVLSHISQNNNTYERAYLNYANYFESLGLEIGKDVILKVSVQDRRGNKFILKEDYNEI